MIREMKKEDYDQVYALWMSMKGFAMRSVDDSREGVARFLARNPGSSVVAEEDGQIVGAILCGHDGRRGCLYHVCVSAGYRRRGIGTAMVVFAMENQQGFADCLYCQRHRQCLLEEDRMDQAGGFELL